MSVRPPRQRPVATLNELSAFGVAFVSLTEAFDMSTPSGRAARHGMLAVFAEFERDLLRERGSRRPR